MTKHRYVDTEFWDDDYILSLTPVGKLMFNFCFTNPKTTICGIYRISMKPMIMQTGLGEDEIRELLAMFEEHGKILYRDGWMAVKNFIRRQKANTNVRKGIMKEIRRVPADLARWALGQFLTEERGVLVIDFEGLSKPFESFEGVQVPSNKLYPYLYPYPYLYLNTTTTMGRKKLKFFRVLKIHSQDTPEDIVFKQSMPGESIPESTEFEMEIWENGEFMYARLLGSTDEPFKYMTKAEFLRQHPDAEAMQ